MLPGVRRVADGHLVRAGHPTLALDDVDPAALDQTGQTLEEAGDDLVLVGIDPGHVDALEGGRHSELVGLPGLVRDLRCVEQRLGRDAADMEAGTAEVALLDQPHRQSQLGCSERARVPAGSCPENEYVELAVGHPTILALFPYASERARTTLRGRPRGLTRPGEVTGNGWAHRASCPHGSLRTREPEALPPPQRQHSAYRVDARARLDQ